MNVFYLSCRATRFKFVFFYLSHPTDIEHMYFPFVVMFVFCRLHVYSILVSFPFGERPLQIVPWVHLTPAGQLLTLSAK